MNESPEQEVRGVLAAIRTAWTSGRPDDLHGHFHPEMVILRPDFASRVEGREACVETFREFLRRAVVRRYDEHDLMVDVRGATAVATFRFEIEYELAGAVHHETGHDLFVLTRDDGRWLAVWRTMVGLVEAQ